MKKYLSSLRRLALTLGSVFLLAYCLFVWALSSRQNELIFPGHVTQGQPGCTLDELPPDVQLLKLTTRDGLRVDAAFSHALTPKGLPVSDPVTKPTVLFFYGNGMCMKGALVELEYFRRLGANVLVPDYLGYGMSSGDATEKHLYETADTAYEYLLTRKDVDSRKIIVVGWSLGGAVAIDLAAREPVAGLLTVSTFTSLDRMARLRFPFLPTHLLLHSHFSSWKKIARVHCPILIVHGTEDGTVPFEMSKELMQEAGARATRFSVPSADHMNIFKVGGLPLINRIQSFLQKAISSQSRV